VRHIVTTGRARNITVSRNTPHGIVVGRRDVRPEISAAIEETEQL
jgi:hypothetical protein